MSVPRWPTFTVLLTVLALSGCGDDSENGAAGNPASESSDSGQVQNATAEYTADDVIQALDLQADEDSDGTPDRAAQESDLSFVTPDGQCDIAVIMVNKQQVETYASAGDSVATNPAGNAGVKFSDAPGCGDKLAEGLKKLK